MNLREADIRPADLLEEYLRLNEEDGKYLLKNVRNLKYRTCPACDTNDTVPAFKKNGFNSSIICFIIGVKMSFFIMIIFLPQITKIIISK